ncbi:MAG: hypothetical protein HY403_03310, partial [Elusimicrobia bacterium]|nr:hypothetical protein [Elusimicrobiota bacterium]
LRPVAAGKRGDWALHRYLGDAGEEARFDEALRRNPRSADDWLGLSDFHLRRREFRQALEAAKRAASLEKSPRTDRRLYDAYRGL